MIVTKIYYTRLIYLVLRFYKYCPMYVTVSTQFDFPREIVLTENKNI